MITSNFAARRTTRSRSRPSSDSPPSSSSPTPRGSESSCEHHHVHTIDSTRGRSVDSFSSSLISSLSTGGAGFVGSHLVDRLMLLGHEVTVVDNFFTGSRTTVSTHNTVFLIVASYREVALAVPRKGMEGSVACELMPISRPRSITPLSASSRPGLALGRTPQLRDRPTRCRRALHD